MNKSNDDTLGEFLETASEDDVWRAIRVESDAIPAFEGWLPIHLSYVGATKEILLNTNDYKRANDEELRKIVLDKFREELNVNM